MRKESIVQKTYLKRDKIYPVVVPIIIYTGFQKWKMNTILENTKECEVNWINLQDYSFEDLLNKKTLFANFMIAEKCKGFLASIVQNMVENKLTDDKIMKYTGISKEELKMIKEKC